MYKVYLLSIMPCRRRRAVVRRTSACGAWRGGVQQRREQQDECRPRRAEEMNGSVHVHFCFY